MNSNLKKAKTMKGLSSLLLIVIAFLLFSSCRKKIEGSGRYITVSKNVREFTQVESSGDFTVHIKQDAVQSVIITGEDNIIPHIITHVSGSKLKIYFDDIYHNYNDHGINIYISVPKINQLSLTGSGKVITNGSIQTTHLSTVLTGSGDMDVTLECNTSSTMLSGSGDITLHGISDHAVHTISGSGTIRAFDLLTKEAEVTISGSGNCMVHATDYLHAQISGSGDIRYLGNPKIESIISGSGTVKPY